MRILFINNYFSPCEYGWGYRQLCEEVIDGLVARGHQISVLTSTELHGAEIKRPFPVHRLLQIEPDWDNGRSAAAQFFFGRRQREQEAIDHLQKLVDEFRPDLIFAWHTIGIPRIVLQEAQRLMNGRIAFYFADYQPEIADEYIAYWQGVPNNRLARVIKQPVATMALNMLTKEGKPIQIDYENVACVSGYVRDRLVSKNLVSEQAIVIHNGVDLEQFERVNGRLNLNHSTNQEIACLVAGRLDAVKGVHTVIEGLGRLTQKQPHHKLRLTILGDGPAEYIQLLHQKTADYQLESIIQFKSSVSRSEMPNILNQHDILILASEYDEPLARASQEAMAMGLMVIGTTTGGSGELLIHEQTGLAFDAGDANSLMAQFERILDQPELLPQLAQAGYRVMLEHFNMVRMVDEVETYLQQLIGKMERV